MMQDVLDRGDHDAGVSATCFRWRSLDGAACVTLDCEIVDGLKSEVLAGFHALPKRGAEVGGLLLGRFENGAGSSVSIEAYQPLACEYRFGPSFVLSETDRRRLEAALEALQQDELSVVGYYRSCTGRELAFDAADEELIRTYFADPRQVFLLVKPVSMRECVAAFLFWQGGNLETTPQGGSFPLDAGRLGALEPALQRDETEIAAAEEQVPEEVVEHIERAAPEKLRAQGPVPELSGLIEPELREPLVPEPALATNTPIETPARPYLPSRRELQAAGHQETLFAGRDLPRRGSRPLEPDEEEQVTRKRGARWHSLMYLIVLAAGIFAAYEWWLVVSEPRSASLGLNAKQTANGVEVSWDKSIPAVHEARRGVLSITDGSVQNDIELNAAAVARGTFTYQPSNNNVLIRFRLYGDGLQSSAESLRIVTMPHPAAPPAPVVRPEPAVLEKQPGTAEKQPTETREAEPQPAGADKPSPLSGAQPAQET